MRCGKKIREGVKQISVAWAAAGHHGLSKAADVSPGGTARPPRRHRGLDIDSPTLVNMVLYSCMVRGVALLSTLLCCVTRTRWSQYSIT